MNLPINIDRGQTEPQGSKSSITIFEPLNLEEESERLRLERQVERAFYRAGLALQTLRDKRLYRSTHKTFQEYCQDRFGFTRRKSDYLIAAVEIFDNLSKNHGSQIPQEPSATSSALFSQKREPLVLILPTNERQCRPLKSLEPAQQLTAWSKAVEKASGKVPSAKIVKEVVNQLKNQDQSTELENHSQSSNNGKTNKIRFVPLENPRIGQEVRICKNHPLFPQKLGIITQIPNNRSVIVELNNQNSRELIDLKDLEVQRIVDKNGKVSPPYEGFNYVQGVGVEWYVRVDEETWQKLDRYAKEIGTATLGGAIARLLESQLD